MKWITREHVKVDRVACPWLIKKFVDPAAEFLLEPAIETAYGVLASLAHKRLAAFATGEFPAEGET
jgi:hypothetical protein